MIAKNSDVKKMYSDIAPFPGTLIGFLNDRLALRKWFYKRLIMWRWKNKEKQYANFSKNFMGFAPESDAKLRILDLGCGTGERTLALKIAFPNAEVVGVDISESSISYAKTAANELGVKGIKFHVLDIQHDVEKLDTLGLFDLVHSIGVLHHTESPGAVLNNIANIMSPDAIFYLMVYADYGERHTERLIREAICKLIPQNDRLHERYNLAKELGIFRLWGVVYGTRPPMIEKIMRYRLNAKMAYNSIKTMGLSWYLRPNNISPNYDAFAHPIATNFTADTLKSFICSCDSPLTLMAYRFEPDQELTRTRLSPHLPSDIDVFSRISIEERFVQPWGYYLVLRRQIN